MPSIINADQLGDTIGRANSFLAEEHIRTRSGFSSLADPGKTGNFIDITTMPELVKKFPFLNDYPADFLLSTPFEVILKAESTSMKLKEMETGRKTEARLSTNRENLLTQLTAVTAGSDNRWDLIHDARFLPGATCSAAKLWLQARGVIGSKGHPPVSTYDMGSVGLGGCVTPKGWLDLHDPGSTDLSLKLFTMNNCGNKTAGSKTDSAQRSSEWEEISEIGEFKVAMRTLRTAMSFVHPWNFSIAAIDGFLHQSNFCHSDISGLPNQGRLLTQFVDYVLGENANRWRGQEKFMTAGDLRNTWPEFLGNRPEATLGKMKTQQGQANNQTKYPRSAPSAPSISSSFSTPPPNYRVPVSNPLFWDDICVLWNIGKCVKPPGVCFTKRGVALRHVCNHRPDPRNQNIVCGKDHPSKGNH